MQKKILYNGKIYTENADAPWAEALVINGRVLEYVGTNEGAQAFADSECERIDLEGRTVIPGLLDGHTHPAYVSNTFWFVQGPLTHDRQELRENIRRAAQLHPKEECPYFYYENYFTETFSPEGPNKSFLDEIVNDRPARMQDFGDHACCYNSVALEMLKDESGRIPVDPSGKPEYITDENGEYTGWALEATLRRDTRIFDAIGWKPDDVMNDKKTRPLLDYFKQYGIMGFMDGFTEGEDNLRYIFDLDQKDRLDLYYEGACAMPEVGELEECITTIRKWQNLYTTNHIRINTVKFFIDGTNELGDCLSVEPFVNDPTGQYYGKAYATMEEMRDVMIRLNEEGIDFHVHTICDGAFRLMCDAVEEAKKRCDEWRIKICLTHCELIHPDDIHRVRELGIYLDHSTHWAGGYFGEGAKEYLGEERWNTMHDFSKVIADGGKVGFSSDVFSYQEAIRANPMIGMQIAMTRVDPWVPLDPDRFPGSVRPPESGKLSIEQLIHGYTVINAERMRLDDIMGSLEKGKLANFVVFDEDIFRIAHETPERFSEIKPYCTYFEGNMRQIVSMLKKG